jgi:hypothetical protein
MAAPTTLTAAVTASGTTFTVASGTNIANNDYLEVDYGQGNVEYVQATAGGGTTNLTVTRGVLSSTAAAHANGAVVIDMSLALTSGTGMSTNDYLKVGSEYLQIISGAGTTTPVALRALLNSTAATHASSASVTDIAIATLDHNALSTVPVSQPGILGELVAWNYTLTHDLDIGNLSWQSVGYFFKAGASTVGIPIFTGGGGGTSVKQNIRIHDITCISAANGCFGNNGPVDTFSYENWVMRGGSDSMVYLPGMHSNGTVRNILVDNTQWPVNEALINPGAISYGLLAKALNHVVIENFKVRCASCNAAVDVGDYQTYDVTVDKLDADGEGSTSTGFQNNISTGLRIVDSRLKHFTGNAVSLTASYANGIENMSIDHLQVAASGSCFNLSDNSGTGLPGGGFNVDGLDCSGLTGNAINIAKVSGRNFWKNIQLQGSGGSNLFQMTGASIASAINFIDQLNMTGETGFPSFDYSTVFGPTHTYSWTTAGNMPVPGGLVKLGSAGGAFVQLSAAADTDNAIGIAVDVTGTTAGVATVADVAGDVLYCITTGNVTVQHWVQISGSGAIASACNDTGSTSAPASGEKIGVALRTTSSVAISALSTDANGVMTVTTSASHGLNVGENFTLTGTTFNSASYQTAGQVCTVGTSTCAAPTSTTFTFIPYTAATVSASGSGGQVNPPVPIRLALR